MVCGASCSQRIGALRQECSAELAARRGMQQQRRRLHRGLHPNCRTPASWVLQPGHLPHGPEDFEVQSEPALDGQLIALSV
eukprot:2344479-Amphidinium_carterae.1